MENSDGTFDNPTFTSDGNKNDLDEPTPCDSKCDDVCTTTTPGTQENRSNIKTVVQGTINVIRRQGNLFLVTLSALLFSIKSLLTALLVESMNPFQVILLFMPVMLTGSLCTLVCKQISPPKDVRRYFWILLGGFSVLGGLSLPALALRHMDVGDIVTIMYASLMFTGILSWIMLREPLKLLDFINVFIAFAGVIFISRPPFIFGTYKKDVSTEKNVLLGSCLALGASFSAAMVYTVVRKQSTLGIHAYVSMFFTAVVVTSSTAIMCTALGWWKIPSLQEWGIGTAGGLSYFGGQASLFISLSVDTSTYVNIFMTSEIIFTFLLQFIILHVAPTWTSYVGAVLVIISCVGVAFIKKETTPSVTNQT